MDETATRVGKRGLILLAPVLKSPKRTGWGIE